MARKFKNWTAEEIDFLEQNFRAMSNGAIGAKLMRTSKSVSFKMNQLGLARTQQEKSQIMNYKPTTINELVAGNIHPILGYWYRPDLTN